MDPNHSGQGQEEPPQPGYDLTPSSRGRQRKKNPKYFDSDTYDVYDVENLPKPRKRSSGGGRRAASEKTPAKSDKNGTQQTDNGEEKSTDQESGEKPPQETPKKTPRAKKTPAKKTPARKTPVRKTPAKSAVTTDCSVPAGGDVNTVGGEGGDVNSVGGDVNTVQLENGTPKPKRKYTRRKSVPAPVEEPPCEEAQEETQVEPEEEMTPGGRRRRGAAKMALKYLHILAKEVLSHDESDPKTGSNNDVARTELKGSKVNAKAGKGRGRKRKRSDSDAGDDEDFVPGVEEEEEEEEDEEFEAKEEEEEEAESIDSDSGLDGRCSTKYHHKGHTGPNPKTPNGLSTNLMRTIWESTKLTKKFREEHYNSWVFPEWVPSSSDWHLVPQSDVETYLPQELQSAAFRVSREGSKEQTPLQRLSRFSAVPAHPERWDMSLYAGGPVWALEWCPTPDGALTSQYIAVACHRGIDDEHHVNKTYGGSALVQLWDLGNLEHSTRPESTPALAYGLAQDKGFIWKLKWCPAGGWEPPDCAKEAPLLPRLGLLAVATSTSVVTIYSLPHPDALHSSKKQEDSVEASEQLPIYQAEGVITLKLGAFKAPRHENSGLVLCMDWSPEKPHNIIAIGFYDGIVGLWDLTTKSSLLRVRESESLSLLPYQCFLAHDNAVRALTFCPASRYLMATAGEDRYVKTWDLRRLYDPLTIQKRYLTNEISWPLNAPGILLAQENAYAAYGSQGVHYFDHHFRALFAIPRKGTIWSISYTEWLNGLLTSDSLGEVILALLPQISLTPQYVKRTLERRFPVYITSLVPHDSTKEQGGAEEEGDAAKEQEGGETEGPDAASEGGSERENENGGDRGSRKEECPGLRIPTYREAVKSFYLHYTDNDMRSFERSNKRAVWQHMKKTELKAKLNMDELPLAAIHKVRFSPNMNCHNWVASGGRTGLVRLHCLKGVLSPQSQQIMDENKNQFNAPYSPKDPEEAVQSGTDEL